MIVNATTVSRITLLGLVLAAIPATIHWYEKHNEVDTQAMLDVSVSLKTVSHVRTDGFGDSVWQQNLGSGFLVSSSNCEVWTNHHVIADAALIEIFPTRWNATTGIPAVVIASSPKTDIAILKMAHCESMPEAILGDSGLLKPGDESYAVGNPLGNNPNSISRGIISHTERYARGAIPYLQTDAAINPGNSGGALFNHRGEVVGVNVGLASNNSGVNVGIGYAVPINVAKAVATDLRLGPPSWGTAGLKGHIGTLSADKAELFGVAAGRAAIIVTKAPSEGPSAQKLFAHDVIFQIDGTALTDAQQAIRIISARNAGDTLEFSLIRHGQPKVVDIMLGEGWQEEEARSAEHFEGHLGMNLEDWAGQEGERGRFSRPVITKVHSLGPAHKAQIASSQHALGARGPMMFVYQLDVKTVTGVVYEGKYHPIEKIEDVEHLAATAYASEKPLLLEVQLWVREDPYDFQSQLQHSGTGFFRIRPSRSRDITNNQDWHPVSGVPHVDRRDRSA